MVQSLGISVGNSNSYVAAGQGGGIELLLNEYSNRSTPSMVAFSGQVRAIGVDASSNFFMNLKNTVYDLMILVGKPYRDIQLEDSKGMPLYPFAIEEGPDGQALVSVKHLGEDRKFTVSQILAMLFTKLRGIAGDSIDCVLSCPQFYTDNQKLALLQAAAIAGLNPLQIITDMSAVVLNYAYYRTTKEDSHKFVAFVNFGQSNLQCAIVWLSPKDDLVRILSAESEAIGGRDFDRCLAEHFITTHKLNLNQKAHLKLMSACEKLKRLLSANTNEIPISVESLLGEDKDFNARIDRATFETISEPILRRVTSCLSRALQNAVANFEQVISETVDAAKAAEVARAAEAQKTAELSKVAEAAKAAKQVAQAKAAAEALAKVEAQNKQEAQQKKPEDGGAQVEGDQPKQADQVDQEKPSNSSQKDQDSSSKDKETPMEAESEELTKATAEEQRAVQAVKTSKSAEKSMASQASRLNKLAQVKFDLQTVEIVGGSSRIPAFRQVIQNVFKLSPSTTLNTDEAVARGCVLHCATLHPGMKVKRQVRIVNVEPFSKPSGFSCDKDLRRIELELVAEDRKYRNRTEARNNLEEYIYSERNKLQEGDSFLQQLSNSLDWLFSDEGEDASEEAYNARLNELKQISNSRMSADKKETQEVTNTEQNCDQTDQKSG